MNHAAKLEEYKKLIGILSKEEALTLAAEADDFLGQLGPFDPAWAFFQRQRNAMFQYAELLEWEENAGNVN